MCSKCGARDQLAAVKLGTKGKLYAYSIVHRSFPGIEVPYISAIVDLEGGGTLKGNLISVEPDPKNLSSTCPSTSSSRTRGARTAKAIRIWPISSSREPLEENADE